VQLLVALVQGLAGLAAIICCIIVAVKMIQSGSMVLGIVTIITCFCLIGHIIALVWGWGRAEQGNFKSLMIAYTVIFLIAIGGSIISFALGGNPLLQQQ
jgi:hypothetical protein